MACFESSTVIDMEPREAITLQNVRGATLRVTRGTLWLTQENDRNDVVLRAGDNWVVERDGATVMEAQDDTVVCVIGRPINAEALSARMHEPRAASWRERLAALVSGPRYVPFY